MRLDLNLEDLMKWPHDIIINSAIYTYTESLWDVISYLPR